MMYGSEQRAIQIRKKMGGRRQNVIKNWLVVSTHLKNSSQNGNLPQVGMKIKNIWNHQPESSFLLWEALLGFKFRFAEGGWKKEKIFPKWCCNWWYKVKQTKVKASNFVIRFRARVKLERKNYLARVAFPSRPYVKWFLFKCSKGAFVSLRSFNSPPIETDFGINGSVGPSVCEHPPDLSRSFGLSTPWNLPQGYFKQRNPVHGE